MSTPPFLLGAALAFWGWQSDNLLAGALLALAIEAARRIDLRFDLRPVDHNRIADLCTYGFIGLAALLVADRGVSRGVLLAFQWLPVALAPVLLAQVLSASGRVNLSALFRYLRGLKAREPRTRDPLVEVSGAFLAVTAIAAGAANERGHGYYAGVVLLAAWALWGRRPGHAAPAAWLALLALAGGAGYAGHAGLAHAQRSLEAWFSDFLVQAPEDPYRSVTDIGAIGRLKEHDTILLRVYAAPAEAGRARLLHRASYNVYTGTSWVARGAPLAPLEPEADATTWSLAIEPGPPAGRVRIATRFESGRTLLALPTGSLRLTGLPAAFVRRNPLGTVQAEMPRGADGSWLLYAAEFAPQADERGAQHYATPGADDLQLPLAEREAFEAVARELALASLAPADAVRAVHAHLRAFSYSLYREEGPRAGHTPLSDFLTRTKSGHCEYFAAAATLLLRAAGIPARYATGFAVLEQSALEGAYLVRARHAHAWTRVFVEGRWIDLDPTPPVWFEEEARRGPVWERVSDLWRWAGYAWSQREQGAAAGGWWWWLFGALAAALAWRLLRGRRAMRRSEAPGTAPRRAFPGADSEYFAVERSLGERLGARQAEEPAADWAARVSASLEPTARAALEEALGLHQRYRFDPRGLSVTERRALSECCGALLGAR